MLGEIMQNEEVDTFDDGPYTNGPMEEEMSAEAEMSDDGDFDVESSTEGQDSEEETEQAQEPEDFDTDSQVNLLDEKEELGVEKGKEDEEKADDKGDEKDKEGDEDPKSDDNPEADAAKDAGDAPEDVRTLKAFRDGKRYEIPEDAEIKVKVNGKSEKVTLTELRDNYSGKVAYDEKFSKFSEDKKGFEADRDTYEQEIDGIRTHLGEVAGLVKKAMSGEANPTDAMGYLLDLMGADTLQYNKALYENMADEFDLYSQMTEVERDSFWTKKENEYLVKKQESLTKTQSDVKSREEYGQKVHSLREAHGVSEENYVSAEQDLKAEGEEVTPEKVIAAAKLTPLFDTAEGLIEPYLEQMTDTEAAGMIREIAVTMLKTPELTINQVKTLLAEQYEVEDVLSEINAKSAKTKTNIVKNVRSNQAPDHLESFDDF